MPGATTFAPGNDAPMTSLLVRYDMRSVPGGVGHDVLYGAAMDQIRWADTQGFDAVVLSEHHVSEEGYLPSPLVMAGAVAACTDRIAITLAALVAGLHHPIRLAEDLAVLDHLAGGRLVVVFGIGYRPIEFEVFGADRSRRGPLLEELVEILRTAWTGELFDFQGSTVVVRPRPLTPGGPMLAVGGSVAASARRAARLGLPLFASDHHPELAKIYAEECERLGHQGGWAAIPSGPIFVHVTHDPERDWARIGPLAMADAEIMRSWQTTGNRALTDSEATTLEELRAEGRYLVVTPDECVELCAEHHTLTLHPLMGGLDPDLAWQSLELIADQVLPRVRSA